MVIWWYIWQFLRKLRTNYPSHGKSQGVSVSKRRRQTLLPSRWGIGDSKCTPEADETLGGQVQERQLGAVLLLKVQIVLTWSITARAVLLVWALCSGTLESALLTRDRDVEYELDSRTETVSICIETVLICIKSHMLCCRNFHCACFRIKLMLPTEYFSFTEKETSQKEEEFVFLWNDFWEWSLKERIHWRLCSL